MHLNVQFELFTPHLSKELTVQAKMGWMNTIGYCYVMPHDSHLRCFVGLPFVLITEWKETYKILSGI